MCDLITPVWQITRVKSDWLANLYMAYYELPIHSTALKEIKNEIKAWDKIAHLSKSTFNNQLQLSAYFCDKRNMSQIRQVNTLLQSQG